MPIEVLAQYATIYTNFFLSSQTSYSDLTGHEQYIIDSLMEQYYRNFPSTVRDFHRCKFTSSSFAYNLLIKQVLLYYMGDFRETFAVAHLRNVHGAEFFKESDLNEVRAAFAIARSYLA